MVVIHEAPAHYFRDKELLPAQGHTWSAHDHDVLTLVLRGRLDEEFESEAQQCRGFELHYKPAGAVHRTAAGPDGVRMFLIGFQRARSESSRVGARAPRLLGGGATSAQALAAFLALSEPDRADRRLGSDRLRQLAENLEGDPPDRGASPRPSWISEVHERVLVDPGPDSSLGRLADAFRMHAVYLARVYRRHYGVSIGDTRRRVRVDRAVRRLAGAGISLPELALELGYADQSHFSREFKTETGWSPGRFRDAAVTLGQSTRP